MTDTSTSSVLDREGGSTPEPTWRVLIGRISRLEIIVGAVIAGIMLVLVLLEPDILEAPFQNERTLLFTLGGTAIAAVAFGVMLWFRVPPVVRVIVLVVPFVIVNWWLLSPYFIDDVVDEEFSTSISEQLVAEDQPAAIPATTIPAVEVADEAEAADEAATPPATEAPVVSEPPAADAEAEAEPAPEPVVTEAPVETEPPPPPPPSGPVLLGAGQFVGLAGHSGTGDAGIFQNPDGSLVLRFENFDIENGPDLEVYLVPGADQVSLPEGSIHLGALKGNIGDQNYDLPPGTVLSGPYTALVWCEAFSVEFVGATVVI